MPRTYVSDLPAFTASIDDSELRTNRPKHEAGIEQFGWKLSSYCKLISITPQFYHTLPEDLRPRSVKLGKRRIISEHPREYLERLAASQRIGGAE